MKKNKVTVERIYNNPDKFRICTWCFKVQLKNRTQCIKCHRDRTRLIPLRPSDLKRYENSHLNWLKPIDV